MATLPTPSRRRTRTYDVTDIENLSKWVLDRLTPLGSMVSKLTRSSPGPQWMPLEGQELLKEEYPDLYEEIGGAFGETPSTFNLPDLRDTYMVGAGAALPASIVGQNEYRLTVGQMPAHNHPVSDPGHSHGISDPGHTHDAASPAVSNDAGSGTSRRSASAGTTDLSYTGITVGSGYTGISVGDRGDGQSIDNRPRSIAVYYFMRVLP